MEAPRERAFWRMPTRFATGGLPPFRKMGWFFPSHIVMNMIKSWLVCT